MIDVSDWGLFSKVVKACSSMGYLLQGLQPAGRSTYLWKPNHDLVAVHCRIIQELLDGSSLVNAFGNLKEKKHTI